MIRPYTSLWKYSFFSLLLYCFNSNSNLLGQHASDLDLTLQPAVFGDYYPGYYDNTVLCGAVQSDGKIVIGGTFESYNGVLSNRVARIYPDGSLDLSFNVDASSITGDIMGDNYVNSLCIQPDGKIIIGGFFWNGTVFKGVGRLNTDGTLDNSFTTGINVNRIVEEVALQSDGKIIIVGDFTNYDGTAINRIARLDQNGFIDPDFNVGSGFNDDVTTICLQEDGKMIVGGNFTSYNGVLVNRIARLNSDGTLDPSFNIGVGFDDAYAFVDDIKIQPNGKLLVCGSFQYYNNKPVNYLFRLNEDGSIDKTFNAPITQYTTFNEFVIQANGKIVLPMSEYQSGSTYKNLFRLHPNGDIDTSFVSYMGSEAGFSSIILQPNGGILLGGSFINFNNSGYDNFIRIKGDPIYYNAVRGKIFEDSNNDCIQQNSENEIFSGIVKAEPGPFFGGIDKYGNYKISVDTGNVAYTITCGFNSIDSILYTNQCASSHIVTLSGANKDTSSFDFADSIKYCTLLNVSIQNTRMRRCFRSNTYLHYCNFGNEDADNVEIKIEYPPYVVPVSSVPMWTSKLGSVLTYNIGTLVADFCGKITLIDSVVCGNENIRGLTQCIKASISPSSSCIVENLGWDRSSIVVTGIGQVDSSSFLIKNEGEGNMTSAREYRLYANDMLIYHDEFSLLAGEQFNIKYPNEGETIRLEADQDPLHPGKSRPRAIVENFSISPVAIPGGHVVTLPMDDLDEGVAITCNSIVDSYDPNDKQVIPSGTGINNQVAPGEELEYTIRFQNTGSDTAYTVRVVDTLDTSLDIASFIQGTSSHPFRFEVTGKGQAVLAFNFDYIKLPDSTTNKTASNGLVSYRITVPPSTPIGTVIRNKAHIYFDYNSPILTNETMHTVGIIVPQDLSKGNKVQVGEVVSGIHNKFSNVNVKLYPNPSTGIITIETPSFGNNMEFKMYSMLGVLQKSISLGKSNLHELNLEGINQGVYVYEIWQNGERQAGGLFQLK